MFLSAWNSTKSWQTVVLNCCPHPGKLSKTLLMTLAKLLIDERAAVYILNNNEEIINNEYYCKLDKVWK